MGLMRRSASRLLPLLLIAAMAACGAEDGRPGSAPPPAPSANYTARGQEPGWIVTIAGGRIAYEGNYGDRKINVHAPSRAPR
jgi:hypothetical protein